MSASLPLVIDGLAVVAVVIEAWIAGRALTWLRRRTEGAVLADESGRVRRQVWRVAVFAALAAAAALGGVELLAGLTGPLLLLPVAALLPVLVDSLAALPTRPASGPRPWRAFLAQRGRLLRWEAAHSLPVALAVGWAMPRDGWWLAAWAGWAAVLVWREALPPTGRVLTPVAPGPLASDLAALLDRSGLTAVHPMVARESDHSPRMNARTQGLVAGRRLILDDTLIAGLPPEQVLAVAAHEAGHLAGRHREWFALWRLAAGLAALFAADRLGGGAAPAESAALLLLALPTLGFLLRPVETAMILRWEAAADCHAARLAGAAPFAAALARLFACNTAAPEPEPLWAAFHHPHPAPARRLADLASSSNR